MEAVIKDRNYKFRGLTRYSMGSFLELWAISWPLMLASFSGCLMVFIDRAVLSQYSRDAFLACSAAQPWYWTIEGIFMAFFAVSEVFVGRYNGARKYDKIGPFIWQIVILAFSSSLVLALFAHYSDHLIAKNVVELANPYLHILLIGSPFDLAGFGTIAAFFVGRGETKIIPCVLLITNTMNIILDILLVFGLCGFPSMGIHGAAWATTISETTSFFIFLAFFLRKRYRATYHILHFQWSWPLIRNFFHISLANAGARFFGMVAWSLGVQMLALKLPPDEFLAYSTAYTFYLLSFFVMDGLGKGVGTLCSNFIGANLFSLLDKVIYQAFRWACVFALIFLVLLLLYTDSLAHFFVGNKYAQNPDFMHLLHIFLAFEWIKFTLWTLCVSADNFFIALSKTKIVLFLEFFGGWCIVLIPAYFLFFKRHYTNAIIFYSLVILEVTLRLIFFIFWYKKRTWARSLTQLHSV